MTETHPDDSLTVRRQNLPATHHWIRVYERGQEVGAIELLGDGSYLVVGAVEWRPPAWLALHDEFAEHGRKVKGRVLAEAVRLADEVGATLLMMMPPVPGDDLVELGFAPSGDTWSRSAVVAGGQ